MATRTKHLTDEEVLGRLKHQAPEVLEATVDFDALVGKVLKGKPFEKAKTTAKLKRSYRMLDSLLHR